MWRVITGLHHKVEMSFLIAGHTKFSPDGCFGLLKRKFRRTKVNTLEDIAEVVNDSDSLNHVQLVGTQSGETLVPVYDWTNYFKAHFRKLAGIKNLHHITICASLNPRQPAEITVSVREFVDSPPKPVSLVRNRTWCPTSSALPEVIQPRGLDAARQWYLHDSIREYCSEETKDIVCPLPHVPRPRSLQCEEQVQQEEEMEMEETVTLTTTQRRCRKCNQPGHNARTCPLR